MRDGALWVQGRTLVQKVSNHDPIWRHRIGKREALSRRLDGIVLDYYLALAIASAEVVEYFDPVSRNVTDRVLRNIRIDPGGANQQDCLGHGCFQFRSREIDIVIADLARPGPRVRALGFLP